MPIQFSCAGCSQPIEVDESHAGKSAQCPYCRRVITVPAASTFDPQAMVTARPSPIGTSPPRVPDLPPIPTPPMPGPTPHDEARERSARRLGTAALVASVLSVVCLFVSLVLLFQSMGSVLLSSSSGPASMETMEKQLTEIMTSSPHGGLIATTSMLMPALALIGLSLGIASMLRWPAANWRAWLSIGVSGVLSLCFCGSSLMQLAR